MAKGELNGSGKSCADNQRKHTSPEKQRPVPVTEIRRKTGHLDQAAFVRPVMYTCGRARGLEALQFYNGVLDMTVLKDRCMDIGDMRYKGLNMAFLSKTGLALPMPSGIDWVTEEQSNLIGGFMFTCGLSNAGAMCEIDGVKYPFHGQIHLAPAEYCHYGVSGEGKTLLLYAEGRMREAVLQGRNLSMTRRVETHLFQPGFTIRDHIVNEGFSKEPVLLLYHINLGWPLVDEGTRIVIPSSKTRKERMGSPADICGELVLAHDALPDADGKIVCRVENEDLKIGMTLKYSKDALPSLGEWRSEAAGDYVAGLEPGICGVEGRAELLKTGKARYLSPGEKIETELIFEFYDL